MVAQVEGLPSRLLNQDHREVKALEQALQDKGFQAV
jgi:hypothetical protein